MSEEALGRVIITWPPANGPVLGGWGLIVHDADTGEQILDATSLAMNLGSPNNWDGGPITVTLTRLVDADADGQPIGRGANQLVRTDEYEAWHRTAATGDVFEGQHFRIGTFTYFVAEMRTGPAIVPSQAELTKQDAEEFRRRWDALLGAGVVVGPQFRPDPDAVLTLTVPDDWGPDQLEELKDQLEGQFPNKVLVHHESVGLDVGPGASVQDEPRHYDYPLGPLPIGPGAQEESDHG